MESIWKEFAKLVGRVLAERWLRRQGLPTESGEAGHPRPNPPQSSTKGSSTTKTGSSKTPKRRPR